MKSLFKMDAETVIEIQANRPSRMVALLVYKGVEFDKVQEEREPTYQLWFEKAQARAIASNLMAGAAEA